MRCQNCSWSWDNEKDDTHPFLCHKCGYDSEIGDFDMDSLQKWEEENNYPFDEYIEEGYHIRTFYEDIDDMELVWHRDKEDRIVESIGDTDWMIQLDNQLPISLTDRVYIPKEIYHRVIKGSGELIVKIKKLGD
jgi:Zn ribbon nucleic-acid-binding protein